MLTISEVSRIAQQLDHDVKMYDTLVNEAFMRVLAAQGDMNRAIDKREQTERMLDYVTRLAGGDIA